MNQRTKLLISPELNSFAKITQTNLDDQSRNVKWTGMEKIEIKESEEAANN
jgi:hypothetical protein